MMYLKNASKRCILNYVEKCIQISMHGGEIGKGEYEYSVEVILRPEEEECSGSSSSGNRSDGIEPGHVRCF